MSIFICTAPKNKTGWQDAINYIDDFGLGSPSSRVGYANFIELKDLLRGIGSEVVEDAIEEFGEDLLPL